MTDTHGTPEQPDGRRARTIRGKQAAVEALASILSDNEPILSVAHIAERSGLSERTLFRYFGNQDGMFEAVAAHLVPAALAILSTDPPKASLDTRIRELVRMRMDATRRFFAMGRTVDGFVHKWDRARELKAARNEMGRQQYVRWLGEDHHRIGKATFNVTNEMMSFAFLDEMSQRFGTDAADILADHIITLLRADIRRKK